MYAQVIQSWVCIYVYTTLTCAHTPFGFLVFNLDLFLEVQALKSNCLLKFSIRRFNRNLSLNLAPAELLHFPSNISIPTANFCISLNGTTVPIYLVAPAQNFGIRVFFLSFPHIFHPIHFQLHLFYPPCPHPTTNRSRIQPFLNPWL